MKEWFCAAAGVVGASLGLLFGGWDANMITLLIFMAADFVLGVVAAALFKKSKKTKSGKLSSRECWKGIAKKVGTLVLVLLAVRIDLVLGTNYIRNAVIIALIVSEAISVIENLSLIGVPIPKILLKAIDIMKDKSGESEVSENGETQ